MAALPCMYPTKPPAFCPVTVTFIFSAEDTDIIVGPVISPTNPPALLTAETTAFLTSLFVTRASPYMFPTNPPA